MNATIPDRRNGSPIDVVAARLDVVHGSPPNMRARCPAHGSKRGTLSVKELQDGTVLLRCHAGCAIDDVLHAAGLTMRDLFPNRDAQRDRERFTTRRRFVQAPRRTVLEALDRERDELRRRLRSELGFDRPLRSTDLNAIRARVCRIFELPPSTLPPIPPFDWECPGMDDDAAWPTLYMRALEEETRRRWMALSPEAAPWETDPHGPGFYDRIRAERLAREWLRSMTS
jgi:hypothetical protein